MPSRAYSFVPGLRRPSPYSWYKDKHGRVHKWNRASMERDIRRDRSARAQKYWARNFTSSYGMANTDKGLALASSLYKSGKKPGYWLNEAAQRRRAARGNQPLPRFKPPFPLPNKKIPPVISVYRKFIPSPKLAIEASAFASSLARKQAALNARNSYLTRQGVAKKRRAAIRTRVVNVYRKGALHSGYIPEGYD